MWADVLTKPLQGQKFRDMQAFLQNCPRDYDDDIELNIDQLARKSMNQQVKTVASSRECVDEHAKLKTKLKTKLSSQPSYGTGFRYIGSPTIRDSAIGSPTTRDSAIGSPTTRDSAIGSRVTWGPSQVVQIPQRIPPKDPTRMSKGSHKELIKDWRRLRK